MLGARRHKGLVPPLPPFAVARGHEHAIRDRESVARLHGHASAAPLNAPHLIKVGRPLPLLHVARGEADEYVVRAVVLLRDVGVQRVVVGAAEVDQDRRRPGAEVVGHHPANVADAFVQICPRRPPVEVADIANVLAAVPIPHGDVEGVELALVRHLPGLAKVDAVRAGETPQKVVVAVQTDSFVQLIGGAGGVGVLENREIVELRSLVVEDDVVGLRACELTDTQVRLHPRLAVGALRVTDHDGAGNMLCHIRVQGPPTQVVQAVQVVIGNDAVVVAPVTLPGRVVVDDHLLRLWRVQPQRRRRPRRIDEVIIPEHLAAPADVY